MFDVVTATPHEPVDTGDALVFPYPAGTVAADFTAGGHMASSHGLMVTLSLDDGDFTLAFGASFVTMTYFGVTSIPPDTVVRLELHRAPVGAFGADASLLTAGTLVDARLSAAVHASLDLADSATQPGDLAAVATSGSAADVSGLAVVATSGSASDLGSGTLPSARLPESAFNAVYDVQRYGAVLDGVTDDTAAIVAAAADLRAAGKGVLWFPPGRKCLVSDAGHIGYTGDNDRTVLLFTEAGLDVEIAGNGTQILFDADNRTQYGHFVFADDCGAGANFNVHGFDYQYNKPPHVFGVVSSISASAVEVVLDSTPTFSDIQRAWFWKNKQWEGNFFFQNTGTFSAGGALTLVSGSTYSLDITGGTADTADLLVGDEVVLEHQVFGGHFVNLENSGDSEVYGNTVRNTPGSGVRVIGGGRSRAYNNICAPLPGGRVVHSINSDFIHIHARFGEAFDNHIEGSADDGVNLFSHGALVQTRDSDFQLTVGRSGPKPEPIAGQLIQIGDANRVLVQETRIVSVDNLTDTIFQITVSDALGAGIGATHEVSLCMEIGIIRGNTTRYGRSRGLVGMARHIAITDNIVTQPTGTGILVQSTNREYCTAQLIVIENNQVYRANSRATGTRGASAIFIDAKLKDEVTFVPAAIYERVLVSGNIVHDTNNGGILVVGAKSLVYSHNQFSRLAQNTQTILTFTNGPVLMSKMCGDVFVYGNVHSAAAPKEMQVVDTTAVYFGINHNILPSSGTNPVTITASPKGFLGPIDAAGVIRSIPSSGAAAIVATAIAGQTTRMQWTEAGGASWYMGKLGGQGALKLAKNSDDFSTNLVLNIDAGSVLPSTDGVTGTGVTPNGTIKLVFPDGTVKWLLTSATQN